MGKWLYWQVFSIFSLVPLGEYPTLSQYKKHPASRSLPIHCHLVPRYVCYISDKEVLSFSLCLGLAVLTDAVGNQLHV
jgi:hypothetical protein